MSRRGDIRDAVLAAIVAPATSILRVEEGKRDPIPPGDLANGYAAVAFERGTMQPEGRNRDRTRLHTDEFEVSTYAGRAALVDENSGAMVADAARRVEEALDGYAEEIETALAADLTLGGLVITCAVVGIEYEIATDAAKGYGRAALALEVKYRTQG